MRSIVIITLILLSFNCFGQWNSWSDIDKTLFVASSMAITADWVTTRYYSKNKDQLANTYETNKILGRYPDTSRVDLYFVIMLISNYFITNQIKEPYRGLYLTLRTVTHGNAAINNIQLGWRMAF